MTPKLHRTLLSLLCYGVGMSIVASASDADSHPCAAVVKPAERLACYDKAYPPPPAVYEAAASKAVDEFGLAKMEAPLRNPEAGPGADPARIEGKVVRVDHGAGGARTITLDGGQVWMLTEATSRGHMVEGDVVAVRKGALGNYLMLTPAGVSLRVRRIR